MKLNKLLIFFIFIAVFSFYFLAPVDTDLGWHLRYGEFIWKNHQVMKTNQIGFFLEDYHWHHSYSLYQLIIYLCYRYLGFWSLAVFSSLIISITIMPIIKTFKNKISLIGLSLPLLFYLAHPVANLGIRSQLFTLLGVSWLYYIIINQKNLFYLPLMFIFWTNLHGGFILGLIMVVIYWFERLVKKLNLKKVSLIIILSLFAGLINPFGWKIYLETFRHAWYPLNKLIAEWVAPNPQQIVLIIIIIAAATFSLIKKKKKVVSDKPTFLLFSWLFFTSLAFKARRHLPLFGISSIYLFYYLWQNLKLKTYKTIVQLLALTITICIILFRLANFPQLNGWPVICEQSKWTLPCQAVNYLKENNQTCSNIYNAYEWGGFLAWHLPNRKTFVDGRMPAWPTQSGKSPYTIYLEIIQARNNYNQKLNEYGADCLFIANGTFLDLELQNKHNRLWQEIYRDETGVIYKRNSSL